MTDPLHIGFTETLQSVLSHPDAYLVPFKRGDVTIGLYAPRGSDPQGPHERDEAYLIASGSGVFRRDEASVAFKTGDFLFVAAGVKHRFESFTDDFSAWVIFFGPKGGVGD